MCYAQPWLDCKSTIITMQPRQDSADTALFSNGVVASQGSSEPYDVVVVGGGAAGIGAAIGAKQTAPQSRVLIVESEACLGGAATHRGVLSYCGLYSVEREPRRAVGAIWTELHTRLVAEGAASQFPDRVVAYVQVRRLTLTEPRPTLTLC